MLIHHGIARAPGLLISFVVVSVLLFNTSKHPIQGQERVSNLQPLSLETLYHPEEKLDFDGELPAVHWMSDRGATLLLKRPDGWKQFDPSTRNERVWPVANELMTRLQRLDGVTDLEASDVIDEVVKQLESPADSALVRLGKSLAIVNSESEARWLTRDASMWRNATLDPGNRRLAYTRDGDLHVIDAATGRQVRLTNDGTETLLDGILDWTYQEEIYGRGNFKGFWFSPSGDWLAMLRIDISAVEPYTLGDSLSARGRGLVSRYPKAGDPIPHASLLVWDLRLLQEGKIPPPRLLTQSTPQEERLITGVWWNPKSPGLLFAVSDRVQTWRELRHVSVESLTDGIADSTLVLREESPAWVEPPAEPGWLADGSLVWQSELPTGRTRLYRISSNRQSVEPLTPVDFDVRKFKVSAQSDFLILTGDSERGTEGQQVYRVDLDRPAGTLASKIAMSRLTSEPGWHSPSFSPDGKWFTDAFSDATKPPSLALRTCELDGDPSSPVSLTPIALRVEGEMIKPQFLKIKADDDFEIPAMLVRPSVSSNTRVPVVVEVYGGPRAPKVVDRWASTQTLYRQLLARRGIATLVIDNRSSAGNGLADTWVIQGRVGEIEFQDLQSGMKWLRAQPWVDPTRVAIRGWSFGGFMTLYAMTHSDYFRAGIAGGSVTDWSEYDAFYTERYMGLPRNNEQGYQQTAPVNRAAELRGTVLMIHGEADDNVHPSGTLRMAKALQDAGKEFQLMIYPGAMHAIRAPKQLWHMSQMTDRFLRHQLQGAR